MVSTWRQPMRALASLRDAPRDGGGESVALADTAAGPLLHVEDRAAVLRLLGELEATTGRLCETSTRLGSLIPVFRPTPFWQQWWYAFTGKLPEREIFFREMCLQAEHLADQGVADARRSARQLEALVRHRRALRQQQQMLDHELRAARQRLSSSDPGLDAEALGRLSRRTALQEALAGALQATQARCKAATKQARSARRRFEGVLALLRLRWQQRLGFELFTHRLAPNAPRRRSSTDPERHRVRE